MSVDQGPPTATPVAGSNVKGQAAGAAWTYLLDDLAVRTIVCVGAPSAAALVTLRRVAERVVIVGDASSCDEGTTPAPTTADVPDGVADLVYLVTPSAAGCELACRAVAADGRLYVETRAGRHERQLHEQLRRRGMHVHGRFWLTPAAGEARSAVPAEDAAVRRYFVSRGITVPSLHRVFRRAERWFAKTASRQRIGVLAGRSPADVPADRRVPTYLYRLAHADGHDLTGHRYAVSARGQYNSRKVLLYLFSPSSEQPELIVKTTRDAAFNDRLVNEETVLRRVAAEQLVPKGTAPRIAFAGEHGGLRMLAETVLPGRSLWAGTGPVEANRAYEWLTVLALRTARRGPDTARQLDARLAALTRGLDAGYRLEAHERAALIRLADAVREHATRIPLVLSHGDAATWNSVAQEDGSIGFLDWEAARADGIPLWDLWYFARSRYMTNTRLRRRLHLARPSVLAALRSDEELRRAIEVCVSRLELPPQAIGPLFVLCWADRALREITRLEADRLAGGHYIGLVRELLADRVSRVSTRAREPL